MIAAQNDAIRTNYIKAKIDNLQKDGKWKLCGDRDETITPIISNLVQKEYKTRNYWAEKGDPLGILQEIKIWPYRQMQKSNSVLEYETHEIVRNLVPADQRVKIKESEKIGKSLDLDRKLKRLCSMKIIVILIILSAFGMVAKVLEGDWRNWKAEEKSRSSRPQHCTDHQEYSQ